MIEQRQGNDGRRLCFGEIACFRKFLPFYQPILRFIHT